jgi:hypothetical protein
MGEIKRGPVVTYDRGANIQPEDWNKEVVKVVPNSQVPLTAFTDAAGSTTTQSRIHHWWQKDQPAQRGAITGVYTDGAMSSAYASGLADAQVLYLKMAEADAAHLLNGMTITAAAVPEDDGTVVLTALLNLDVRHVSLDGANSRVTVKVLSKGSDYLASESAIIVAAQIADPGLSWFLSGDAQAENSELPDSTFYEPVEFENRTAILMAATEMSGSELKELERVNRDKWREAIEDALLVFRRKREHAFIFSNGKLRWEGSKQRRFYKGLLELMREAGASSYNCATNTRWADKVWDTGGGLIMLDDMIVDTSRIQTKSDTKIMFLGDLGMQSINRVVQNSTHFSWSADESVYGVNLKVLRGAMKTLKFAIHPTFNEEPRLRRSGLITEMPCVKRVNFRPMQFITGKQGTDESGYDWVDGKKAGWMVEESVEATHLKAFAWVDNLGADGPSGS